MYKVLSDCPRIVIPSVRKESLGRVYGQYKRFLPSVEMTKRVVF